MQSREKYWTSIDPDCWERIDQKKDYSIGRLHIDVHLNEKTGRLEKKVVLLYPSKKTFPQGYAKSYRELFGEKIAARNKKRDGQVSDKLHEENHQRAQAMKFPRQNDKYFLCQKVGCGLNQQMRMVSISDSAASIYMLTGGDLRKLTLEQAQAKGQGWFNQHVAPYLVQKKGEWSTKLEKIVGGQFKLVTEAVKPEDIRIYYAPHAKDDAVRIVVTRADRPYFVMKANGERFDASESALALVAAKKPTKKVSVQLERTSVTPA